MLPAIQPSQQAVQVPHSRSLGALSTGITRPQQRLYFSPLPHGQGSFRPGFTKAESSSRKFATPAPRRLIGARPTFPYAEPQSAYQDTDIVEQAVDAIKPVT